VYRQLSFDLYRGIALRGKMLRHAEPFAFQSWRTTTFNATRLQHFGLTAKSFTGRVSATDVANMIKLNMPHSDPRVFRASFYNARDLEGVQPYRHEYVKLQFHGHDCIIDASHRFHSVFSYGFISKMESPYARFVFEFMPPVLVLPQNMLGIYFDELEKRRRDDSAHRNDPTMPRIYWLPAQEI
jgi:hypothetical protein